MGLKQNNISSVAENQRRQMVTEDPVGCETAFSSEEQNNGRLVIKDEAFVHGYFYGWWSAVRSFYFH